MRSFLIYIRTHNCFFIALSAVVCLALVSVAAVAGVEEFARGDQAIGAKDLKKAEAYYTQALSEEPENHRVKYYLARRIRGVDAGHLLAEEPGKLAKVASVVGRGRWHRWRRCREGAALDIAGERGRD